MLTFVAISETGTGIRDAIQHVVLGIVLTLILNTLITAGFINNWYTLFAILFNVGLTAAALLMLGTRSIIYLIGWIIGIVLLLYGNILGTGLIGTIEMIIYVVVPLGFIGLKIYLRV